jgi:2-C-methyl-D-erythritol 4-phosphate cytidylyltransferase
LFAQAGLRRQDSLFHGLQALSPSIDLICVHDAARPFITQEMVQALLKAGLETGAAALAMPVKFTVKEASSEGRVARTLDRSRLWEIQTPQVVRRDLLHMGFEIAQREGITVTDDVGLVELFHHPVQLVQGSYSNIKITTVDDWMLAENIAKKVYLSGT